MTVRIRAEHAAADPSGPPPAFRVRTDRAFCDIEVADDPILFTGALAARRTAANFATSADWGPIEAHGGRARDQLDPVAWASLRRAGALAYRAVAYDLTAAGARRRVQATVDDRTWESAPVVTLAPADRRLLPAPAGLSGTLPWLRVTGNRIVDEAGEPVVLRGVTRSGMERTDRGERDPTGAARPTSREAAGITAEEIAAIARDWAPNVLRVPFNQDWVLTRDDYLAGLDTIVREAAAHGIYTLLDLRRLAHGSAYGTLPGGRPCRTAALPDESSVRAWRVLASRYRREPAVLYHLYSAPHPPLPGDPATATAADWHAWALRLHAVIEHAHGRALVFISGWDWGLDLRAFPLPRPGGGRVADVVYAAHLSFEDVREGPADPAPPLDLDRLGRDHPVAVAEWGGAPARLGWGAGVEQLARDHHRFVNGTWAGNAGWTAWSWADAPLLVQRRDATRPGHGGTTIHYRTFERDGGVRRVTEFGELVRAALGTHPFVPRTGWNAANAAGARARWRIHADATRPGDMLVVRGEGFRPGDRVRLTASDGSQALLVPAALGPRLIVVDQVPPATPIGLALVEVVRGAVVSDGVGVDVLAGPLPADRVLLAGAAKAAPFTIAFVANPVIEQRNGTLRADPIAGNRLLFQQTVALAMQVLFCHAERLLTDYMNDVRVVARFAATAVQRRFALCHELAGAMMEARRDRIRAHLRAVGIAADVCFAVFDDPPFARSTAWFTGDAAPTAARPGTGRRFRYRSRTGWHRPFTTTPGSVALAAPTSALTALHELCHALSEWDAGRCDDLYVDTLPDAAVINRRARRAAGAAVPAAFARLDDVGYASDPVRDGIGYAAAARTFHPQLIQPAQPNLMDNYFLAANQGQVRLDRLTERFLRDRLEVKLGR